MTEARSTESSTEPIQFTPFHPVGLLFVAVGLVFAVYRGLMQFDLVADISWMTWSHIHYVTVGGFTQLIFGMLPQLVAKKLDRPMLTKRYILPTFAGLNGGFLLLWYGRSFSDTLVFDVGLSIIWLTVLGLLLYLLAMVMKSDGQKAWDATIGLYLLSPFIFLIGIIYAIGLYSHTWNVPGAWHGIREAHVHANAWGFLGLAAIGALFDLFPRFVGADLYSEKLKNYSFWLLAAGIFPLITGPWLGMGQTVTSTGLILYGAGFILYAANLAQTYRRGTPNRVARSILSAQVWILGPAIFAPFILFGLPLGINDAWVEQGALHFFFMGWALPIALGGMLVYFRNLPCLLHDRQLGIVERADPNDLVPENVIPAGIPKAGVLFWNLAVLSVGLGFFFQDQSFAAYLHGVGWTVLTAIWAYQLVQVITTRRSLRGRGAADSSSEA